MAQYAGSNIFPASFAEVTDGSPRDAASVNVGLEALADRTIWLKNNKVSLSDDSIFTGNITFEGTVDIENNLSIGSSFDILYNPPSGKTTSIVLSQLPIINIQGDLGWTVSNTLGSSDVEVSAGVVPHFAYWYPQLPELTITDVFCTITPSAIHAGLPVQMPSIGISFIKLSDGSTTSFSGSDASATLVAYQQRHTFSATGINYSLDPTAYKMSIRLTTEGGPNATGIFQVNGIRIAVKRFKYD